MFSFLNRHLLAAFFILTFAVFWLASLLVGSSPALIGLIGSLVPTLVAIALTLQESGRKGVRELLGSLNLRRAGAIWYLVAAGIPLITSLMIYGAAAAFSQPPPLQLDTLLPFIPAIFLLAIGEELGWRGYALPRLLQKRSWIGCAFLLGLIHAGYHLPLWFSPGFPEPSYSAISFLFTSFSLGILWTWLYQSTRGSVIIAAIFHGMVNTAGNLFFAGIEPALLTWIMPVAYALIAVTLLAIYRPGWQRNKLARDTP